jgi:hypothetical protein
MPPPATRQQKEGFVFEGAQAVGPSMMWKRQLLQLRNCRGHGKASEAGGLATDSVFGGATEAASVEMRSTGSSAM